MYEYLFQKVQVMRREYGVWKTGWFKDEEQVNKEEMNVL